MLTSRRFRSVVALLAVVTLVMAGCGSDDDNAGDSGEDPQSGTPTVETITSGTLTVCSDVPYEPFEFEGDGPSGYTGFDIELLAAVAAESDLELKVLDVDFDGILGNLAAENCDVVASATTITDERAQEVDFTEPYFDAKQSLLVPKDSGIASLADVDGKLGVQSGTTGESYANENAPDSAEVVAFDGADALFAALAADQIVAILQDFPVNAYRVTKDDTLEVVETFETGEQYGFAVAKGNQQLLDALDAGLATVRGSGEYDRLFESYFGSE